LQAFFLFHEALGGALVRGVCGVLSNTQASAIEFMDRVWLQHALTDPLLIELMQHENKIADQQVVFFFQAENMRPQLVAIMMREDQLVDFMFLD